MPEGVDMNIEQGRNISPESSGEKPVSQWSFRQVQREKNLLDKRLQDPLASEEQKNEAKGRMGEVRGRLQGLIGDMHEIGALGGVQARYETLELMRQRGELDAKTLLEEQRHASTVDDEVGIDKEDPHYGMVGWYYQARLDKLRASLGISPKTPSRRRESDIDNVIGNLGDRLERITNAQTAAIENLNTQIGGLGDFLRQAEQINSRLNESSVSQDATQNLLELQNQLVENMRGVFQRTEPELEEYRWVDVEYSQEFYTRFTPNMEPRFYTELRTSTERAEWDARWRLARAAYYKKVFSGQAERLADNQDLIELTNEQMEILYKKRGVQFALEWYAKAIVASGNGEYQVGGRSIYGCETGSDFEEIRAKLRSRIARHLGIDKPESDMSVNEITQVKAVDAIAWNWIFCSSLVESADSRYSFSGDRHGNLASEIVSDDLRAVFHPQEKFEDKCRNSQAWGNFGKWGLTQVNRIKDFYISSHPGRKVNYIFAPAKRISDFWKDEIHGDVVTIYAPECYPTTSMKSFWEVYSSEVEGSSDSSATLLSRLLKGENINWRTVQGDPWKTNYLTVKLRKANALFDHFTKESKPGWVRSLLDIYTRLLTKSILREYYSRELSSRGVLGSEQNKEAERLAGIHLHNLKVWADYAVQGGVGMPQNRLVTDPYSTSETGQSIGWHRTSHEHVLRKPQHGYLDKKESLTIESIV